MMKPKYNNILIDAVMHLGDLIHATTLIPLLKQQYPDARISYLVKPELVDLFKNIDNIEYVIPYKYKSKGDYFSVFRMAKEIKKYNFDLSISLDPRLRLSAMMWLAGIPTRVGSESLFGWQAGTERFFFSDYFRLKDYDVKKHSAAENFQYLVKLFTKNTDCLFYKPEFNKPLIKNLEYIKKEFANIPLEFIKIAMCVNTKDPLRNWPVEKFAYLIDQISKSNNAIVFITGMKEDKIVADQVISLVKNKARVINFCGKTNLDQLSAFFTNVDFLVHFDNGMGHFAAAAGCPTITLFSNSNPMQFKPIQDNAMIVSCNYDCVKNCNKYLRKTCGKKCLNNISVEMVMEKVDMMIKKLMNKDKFPKVVIGVCTYNRCLGLKRLLQSLIKLDYPNFEIIVVDNNSTDQTAKIISEFEKVKYIFEARQGLAYARNCLLNKCGKDTEYLGMLDDDETVNEDWILRMLDCFQLDERIAVVGGPYIPCFEITPPAWMPYDFHAFNSEVRGIGAYSVRMAAGGNVMLRMDIVRSKKILFDYTLGYSGKVLLSGEDNDFFCKAMGTDNLCGFTEFAPVKHYIAKERTTFQWFTKRYFYEGITQYHRFGISEYLKNFLQLPLRIVRLCLVIFTFDKEKIAARFFKVVMNIGTVLAPLILTVR